MKRLVLLTSFAIFAFAQTPVRQDEVSMTADSQVVDGAVRHLSGHVEIETDGIMLKADQADFNEDTAVMHLSGHVVIERDGSVLKADQADFNQDTLKITARGHAQFKQHKQDPQTGPGPQQR